MDPRYPVGRFDPSDTTPLGQVIDQIAALPAQFRAAASAMSEAQLQTPYREGGWTARQVIHHLADSHLNAYTRCRLALTEDNPTIKPYDEKRWAELPDARQGAIDASLAIVDGLHARWAALLRSLSAADFERAVIHPEAGRMTLERLARLYAWHCRHHLGHLALSAAAAR